jgi:hypothetical protein
MAKIHRVISELDGPNISVFPDTNHIALFDGAKRAERRFGALCNVADAVSDYGGGKASIVPPSGGEP